MPIQPDIEKLAYELWEKEGRQHGRDQEYYFTAERMLMETGGSVAVADAPKKRAARTTTSADKPKTARAKKQA